MQKDEPSLMDLWHVIVHRRYLFISLILAPIIMALIVMTFVSHKVYVAEAVVNLPRGGVTVNVSEVKALVDTLMKEIEKGNSIDTFDDKLINDIVAIKIEDIPGKGPNTQFKMMVRVTHDPQKAVVMCNKLIEYLRKSEYIARELNIKKRVIESNISVTKKAINNAVRTKNEVMHHISTKNTVAFNLVDLDIGIKDLEERVIELEASLSIMRSFEIVGGPFLYKDPVKPNVVQGVFITGIMGLIMVLLVSFALASANKKPNGE